MKIIVCIKQVPDTKGGVKFNPDGTLDRGAMLAIMNPDDKAGLEAALRLKDQYGAEVTVRAVVSTCDSLNYVTEEEDLLETFKLVNNYLEPDGIFIFDMNAPEKYEEVLADNVFAENRDDASFIWENLYDSDTQINEYALTLFIEDEESGMYEKSEEFHYQRAYSREEIADLLDRAGFAVLDMTEEDMRLFYTVNVIPGRKLGNV